MADLPDTILRPNETRAQDQAYNGAVLGRAQSSTFPEAELGALGGGPARFLVTDDDTFLPEIPPSHRLDFASAGFGEVPLQLDIVRQRLSAAMAALGAPCTILVDMSWGLGTVSASANFDFWGATCDQMVEETGQTLISIYNCDQLFEGQFLAAMRGHRFFVTGSGIYTNPYWLPPRYLNGASLTQQVAFLLSRLVPDYRDLGFSSQSVSDPASGADPRWIASPDQLSPKRDVSAIWKIRCFGRLRIYKTDGSQIQWKTAGGAPKKTKALFAFLLQRGEKGARSEQLAELLWPEGADEAVKRARLHHTITMLRKTLEGPEFVIRNGEYYHLIPPNGSWIDISSFEQLCHRGKVLMGNQQNAAALSLLTAADQLYSGDLFEDILPEYVETAVDDWCMPRRLWFKEMSLKVKRDIAALLRAEGRYREALAYCQQVIAIDPTCEVANSEAMRIFHAQSRLEALIRQYRLFRAAVDAMGIGDEEGEVDALYRRLQKHRP